MKKPKLVANMAFLTSLLLFNTVLSQEFVNFNKVKSTTSSSYNQLNDISTVAGSSFKFTSQNSTFALSKTGNNVKGILSYVGGNGSSINYAGAIEGTFTSSSNTIGLYFFSGNTHFILIVPGTDAILQSLKQISMPNTSVAGNLSNRLVTYLNPAAEEINFTIPKDETVESITIIYASGTKTLIKSKAASKNTVDISKLTKGSYLLEVKTQSATRIANFMKH
jgi:hypothetical protein